MALRAFARSSQMLSLGHVRLATAIMGNRCQPLARGSMAVPRGGLEIQTEALCLGGELGALVVGAFIWRSLDGIASAVNNRAASGGDLYPTGNGPGTLLAEVACAWPAFSSLLLDDEEVS